MLQGSRAGFPPKKEKTARSEVGGLSGGLPPRTLEDGNRSAVPPRLGKLWRGPPLPKGFGGQRPCHPSTKKDSDQSQGFIEAFQGFLFADVFYHAEEGGAFGAAGEGYADGVEDLAG